VLWGDEGLWAQQQPLKMVKLMLGISVTDFLGIENKFINDVLDQCLCDF
jgi:hypothetical protein